MLSGGGWYASHEVRCDEGAYDNGALTGGNDGTMMDVTIKVDGDKNNGHLT